MYKQQLTKYKKNFGLKRFVWILLLMSWTCLAQDSAREKSADFQADFDRFVEKQQKNFDGFLEKQDREFIAMLEINWQAFEQKKPLVRDGKPKPEYPDEIKSVNKKRALKGIQSQQVEAEKKQALSVNTRPENISGTEQNLNFLFYGNKLQFPVMTWPDHRLNNQRGLIRFWKQSAVTKYQLTLQRLSHYKKSLILSDWAFWQLISQYSLQVSPSLNHARALSWFLMNKSGYQVRIALNNGAAVLLFTAKQRIYSRSFYQFDGERYYQLSDKLKGKITSYQGNYNHQGKPMELSFKKSISTQPLIRQRKIEYRIADKIYRLTIPYDYERVRYFSTYPQLDLSYYFNAPVDDRTQKGLLQLTSQIQGERDEKVNHLLAVIHQAFPYAVDAKQFGEENYLMLEETLHYQASDCEDRAVLFAWLVRQILNESVVVLNYPGHVSTGIERKGKIVSADPTYIGATIGQVMPDYVNTRAQVIRID